MIRNILVGLDGGRAAEQSLDWLKSLAPDARLTLLRAYVPLFGGSDPWMDEGAWMVETNARVAKSMKKYLEEIASRLDSRPRLVVRAGSGAGALLDEAREGRYDLIAITSQGGKRLQRRLVGGTTEQLIHNARLPLFVVPLLAEPRSARGKIRRIAVLLDGSPSAETILPLSLRIARDRGAELLLVHAFEGLETMTWESGIWAGGLPDPESRDTFNRVVRRIEDSVRARLGELVRRAEKAGVHARAVFVRGKCPEALLGAVRKCEGDLIALCVHGHGALQHLLQGSMASKIVQNSRVPVLLARNDTLKARPGSAEKD